MSADDETTSDDGDDVRPDDALLVGRLRTMWEALDPPPPDLPERMVFAVQLERIDAEVMRLSDELLEPVRGQDRARTLTFTSDSVSVMVTVTPQARNRVRIDGWVVPTSGGRLEVRRSDGRLDEGAVDLDGRFAVAGLQPGLVQLVYHPGSGHPPRPVAAPPVRL